MDTWPWETGESGPNGAAKAKPKASSGDIFTLLPHFDGSKRAAWPGFRDLVRGTVTEFIFDVPPHILFHVSEKCVLLGLCIYARAPFFRI